jgi:hypothetical protein
VKILPQWVVTAGKQTNKHGRKLIGEFHCNYRNMFTYPVQIEIQTLSNFPEMGMPQETQELLRIKYPHNQLVTAHLKTCSITHYYS